MDQISTKLRDLLDYLGEIVKLVSDVVRDVEKHNDFLLFQHELAEIDGVILFSDSWIEIHKQEIRSPPVLPKILEGWVQNYEDPDVKPEIIQERIIDNERVNLDDDLTRVNELQSWLKSWEEWAEVARKKKFIQKLFTKLFHINERLKYDETIELIWGQGLLLWRNKDYTLKYPIITQRMVIDYDAIEGIIDITPQEDSEPNLEFEIFRDLDVPDLTDIRSKFKEMDFEPWNRESYIEILKEIAGRLSPDGQVVDLSDDLDLKVDGKLRIVDCWMVFIRKRRQDALTKDIESFKKKIENEIEVFGGFLKFLEEPKEELSIVHHKPWDEYSALIEKEILFPLPANQEQLQILDRIEQTDSVIVWGPPGTGKSHTIANLICHFMAKGKRILVTSQKDQALAVLQDLIPEKLRPLTISDLVTVKDSRKRIERAIDFIMKILSNYNPVQLRKEIEDLENTIDEYREKLQKITNKIKDLVGGQLNPILYKGKALSAADWVKELQKEAEKHKWLEDIPNYEIRWTTWKDRDAIEIIVNYPISDLEIKELKDLRKRLLSYLKDFQYEIPRLSELIDGGELNKVAENLKKSYAIDEQIENLLRGLIFKDDSDTVIEKAIHSLENALKLKKEICDDWQFELQTKIREESLEIPQIEKVKERLLNLKDEIADIYNSIDIFQKIEIDEKEELEIVIEYVKEAVERVKDGKKPWGLFGKKKKILQKIKINGRPPKEIEDWEFVSNSIELMLKLNEFQYLWNSLAKIIDLPEFGVDGAEHAIKAIELVEKLNAPFEYEKAIINVIEALDEVLVGIRDVFSDDKLDELYKALSLKKEQKNFFESKFILESQKELLASYLSRPKPHPIIKELTELLNQIIDRNLTDQVILNWEIAYKKIEHLNSLKPDYINFTELLSKLEKMAPKWAEKWKTKDVEEMELCPPYWRESLEFNAINSYIDRIINETEKIDELERGQQELENKLRRYKEDLILNKTRLSLIENITDANLQALKRWHLAIRKLGKGTGKYAWKRRKKVQEEMQNAQKAIPVWIMRIDRVYETIPPEFGIFDMVIIDEASQSNILALPAIMRGKKIVIVGDPEQISPESIGISEQEVERLIKTFLKDIPNGDYFDLKTSLYHLAEICFGAKGTIMLREHFRCVPEIIQFCNDLCYQGKILPLRNPPSTQRIEPPLMSVYVEGGYREGRLDVNKPEAEKICQMLQELTKDPRYAGKTFGVISLTGKDQAKYITNKISEFVSVEELDRIKFRAGDSYDFQGDERDIILLSMVVGANDGKRLTALTHERYRQRFNVAVSRAKDQLILFHSVKLGRDLRNPDDLRYRLMEYVQNYSKRVLEKEKVKDLFESPFEEAVYDWLTKRGYKVIPQVKVGNYRIDLVVEGEKNRLAIECDGDRYHGPDKWWDDRIRQRQLERRGWVFWRVWASAFYKDPDAAMNPVIQRLEEMGIKPMLNAKF